MPNGRASRPVSECRRVGPPEAGTLGLQRFVQFATRLRPAGRGLDLLDRHPVHPGPTVVIGDLGPGGLQHVLPEIRSYSA